MMKTMIVLMVTALSAVSSLASEGTLSASPAVVMLGGTPGQGTTQTLTLVNSTSRTLSFVMRAKDVVVRDGRRVFVDAGELPGSVAATAVFSPPEVRVKPGERVSVDVTLTIPLQPAARAVVALFQGTTRLVQGDTSMTASIGTLLTFTLSGHVSAQTSAVTLRPPTPTSNLSMTQQMVNNGTEPVFAKGMLAIVDAGGSLVGKETLPPRRLLPGEQVEHHVEYGGDLPAGRYHALLTYELQNNQTLTSSAEFDVE
jgi:hypothetical protein